MLDPLSCRIICYTFQNDIYFSNIGLVNDKPTNLAVANITSRSAEISWLDPKNHGKYGLSHFWIKLKKNVVIRSFTTRQKVNEYEIDNLTPHATYEISVTAGNDKGYSEGTTTTILTSEEGICIYICIHPKTARLIIAHNVKKLLSILAHFLKPDLHGYCEYSELRV